MSSTFLYKYRNWSPNTIKIINDNELYFSLPKDFNDPFDCRILLKIEGTYEQFYEHFLRNKTNFIDAWKREIGALPDQQIDQEIEKVIKENYQSTYFPKFISQHHVDRLINSVGVCCFSHQKDNILMWSHYADSHRGICLEFSAGGNFFGAALPVKYPAQFPATSFFASNQEKLEACILTKSAEWRYEDEHRIALPGIIGNVSYPSELLSGIILGCQISEEDKIEVVNLITQLKNPVKLYQSVVREDTFKLDILPIE